MAFTPYLYDAKDKEYEYDTSFFKKYLPTWKKWSPSK